MEVEKIEVSVLVRWSEILLLCFILKRELIAHLLEGLFRREPKTTVMLYERLPVCLLCCFRARGYYSL